MSSPKKTPSFAEINLSALKANLRQVRAQIGDCPIVAVVKANAYGHGAEAVSRFLSAQKMGIRMFGVAFFEEGLALRSAGIQDPILVLTGCAPDQMPDMIEHQLTPVVFDLETLQAINAVATKKGSAVKIHLKVDTGMGRLGIAPEKVRAFVQSARACPMIRLEGILTHFAEADLDDLSFAQKQLTTIKNILADLKNEGIAVPFCHLANSAAILHFKPAHLNWVRPGLMLYGYSPLKENNELKLNPIMQVKARIIALKKVSKGTAISYGRTFVTQRESRIATVAIGYADGYPLSLSNCGMMIARGVRVPVAGRVCMDMTMLDVTDAPPLAVGDFVTVIGAEGKISMWADHVARLAKTHPYEILCGIGPRVQRRYIQA